MSTAILKPIETIYNGYRFRSRLEARWAVFFDALGVRWYYEHEGFELRELGYYLPDFYLPDFQCWIEIKGSEPKPEELEKVERLSEYLSERGEVAGVFWGMPGENAGIFYLGDVTDSTAGSSSWKCFFDYDASGTLIDGKPVIEKEIFYLAVENEFQREFRTFDLLTPIKSIHSVSKKFWKENFLHPGWRVQEAIKSAKQARFEHYDREVVLSSTSRR